MEEYPTTNTKKTVEKESFIKTIWHKIVFLSTISVIAIILAMLVMDHFQYSLPFFQKDSSKPKNAPYKVAADINDNKNEETPEYVKNREKKGSEYNYTDPVVVIGDTLNIRFFEDIYNDDNKNTRSEKIPSNIIERTEFSGEYIVQRNGKIYVPMLGALKVSGMTHEETTFLLQKQFENTVGNTARVGISIGEREPIYLTGPTLKTSVLPYRPGLTVLHALVLSKNNIETSHPLWQSLEINRETERTQKSQDRITRLLARHAILVSASEDPSTDPAVPVRLLQLVGKNKANEIIQRERRIRDFELSDLTTRKKMIEQSIEFAKEEKKKLEESIPHLSASLHENRKQLTKAKAMKDKKSITSNTYTQIKGLFDDALAKHSELMIRLTRIDKTIAEEEHQLSRLNLNSQMDIEKELIELKSNILEEETTLATIGKLMKEVSFIVSSDAKTIENDYEIIRRTPEGLKTFTVEGMTLLEPGDILQLKENKDNESGRNSSLQKTPISVSAENNHGLVSGG